VTHNLGIVARMCDKLAVMYAGKIVEAGSVRELFNAPQHPYTKALIGSMPKLGSKAKLLAIPGQPPDLATLPAGCAFHPRCPEALPLCATDEPGEVRIGATWTARCWRAEAQAPPPAGDGPAKEIPRDMHAAAVGN
jgi:oligopeptide/dipeptide ABC transporter ATP-binding protein